MKLKLPLASILFWIFSYTGFVFSQTANTYQASVTTGATLYTGTFTNLIGTAIDNGVSAVTNIGFTFVYEGTNYTQFSVNSNGLIRLGGTVISNDWTNDIDENANNPKLMPAWDDLHTGSNGNVAYQLTGSSPNRALIVRWRVRNQSGESGNYTKEFQAILYEGSNRIEYIYGTGTNFSSASIGIGGATNTNYLGRNQSINHTFLSLNGLDNITNWPGSGTKYIFTPFNSTARTANLTTTPQWVNIGDLDVSGSQITVEALVYYTGGVNIISKHTDPSNVNYLLRVGTFELTTTNGFSLMTNPYAGSMVPNQWYHIAGTYDGANVKYYVNGCLIVTQPWTGTLITNNLDAAIGSQSSTPSEQFFGQLDEVRIWNIARTEAQIKANMMALPSPTTETNLLGYYKMDNNVINIKGNALYNGTWIGASNYVAETAAIPTFSLDAAIPTNATCAGHNNGQINILATGTSLQYSLDGSTWQSPNTFSSLPPNTYTVYVKTAEGCVLNNTSVIVAQNNVPAPPTVSASNPNFCAPNTTNLVAKGMAPSDNAVSFSTGSFSYVNVPHTASYNFTGVSSTVECWVNPSSYTGEMIIFNKENQYEAAIDGGSGKLKWAYAISPAPGWTWITTNSVIPLNTWTHIAIVHDRTGGTIKSYVNGSLVHTQIATVGVDIATGSDPFRIGNRSFNSPFYGKIDNVRLWSTARAQNQIINNMYLEVPLGAAPNLIANYSLNGNGNALVGTNGTLVDAGGTTWINPNYYTYAWSGGPLSPSPSINETQTTGSLTSANIGTHYYQTTASNGTCTSSPSSNVMIVVNGTPNSPSAIQTVPSSFCSGAENLSVAYQKPVAEYPFDGNLNDISGNGLHLSVTSGSATYLEGGLYLNGGGSLSISSPSNSFLSDMVNYTIEFDMKMKVNDYAFGKIFTWAPAGNRAPGIFHLNTGTGLHWRHDSDATPCCGAGGNQGVNYAATTLDQWYHVVGVRKGTQFTLYLDGVQVAQVNDLPTGGRVGNAPFVFGAFSSNPAPQGTIIKGFKIYNNAFDWLSTSCSGTYITSTPTLAVNPINTATYYLKSINNCGTSSCNSIIVDRGPIPAPPAVSSSAAAICAPGTANLLANGMAPGGQYATLNNNSADYITGTAFSSNLNNHTIEFWVKPNRTIVLHPEVSSGVSGSLGSPTTEYSFAISPINGGATNVGTGVSVGTNGIEVVQHGAAFFPVTLSYAMSITDWVHIAVVTNNNQPKLYVNGSLVKIGVTSGRPSFPGTSVSQGYGYFSGSIDNVRAWNISRTQSQIITDMNLQTPTVTTGLLNHLPLNGNGTALTGSNASINGGTSFSAANYYTYTWSGGPKLPGASTNETQTTGTFVAADAGSYNYTAISSVGGCSSNSSTNVPITISTPSTLPTSISVDNNTNNCWGREITLTENGGVLQGTSQYIYGTSIGGTELNTGTTSTTQTTVPTGSATYYVGVTANGACPAQNLTTGITYNLPSKGSNLSGNESATCYISGTNPIHFYNLAAPYNYIGSINPQGRTGTLTMTSYIGGVGDNTMYACNRPTAPQWRTAFMERSFTVIPTGAISGSGDLNVYFPFSATEYSNLQTKSTGVTLGNTADNVSILADLVVTKYSNSGSENGTPYDNCLGGTSSVIGQNGNGATLNYGISPAITANYIRVPVSSFSEFYLHGQNNNSPLPITLTSFSGNCEKDGIQLSWTTATETNVNHFEVERSRDGQTWEVVATVNAVGNSSTANNYHAIDNNGFETLYYRLRSVDNDGTSETFNPIAVSCHIENSTWSIYPVPVTNKATVTINAMENATTKMMITDMNGRLIQAIPVAILKGTNTYDLDVQSFASGAYFIRIDESTSYKPLKFIKVD